MNIQKHTLRKPRPDRALLLRSLRGGFVVLAFLSLTPQAIAADDHPAEAKGYQQSGYNLSQYENINLANGNLTFRVPLHTLTTDGGLAYEIALIHNLKKWRSWQWCEEFSPPIPPICGENPDDKIWSAEIADGIPNYGIAWDLRPPRVVVTKEHGGEAWGGMNNPPPHWVDPSGATHHLVNQPPNTYVIPQWTFDRCLFTPQSPECFTGENYRATATEFDEKGKPTRVEMESPDGTRYIHDYVVDIGVPGTPEEANFQLDRNGLYLTSIERGPWVGAEPQNTIAFEYCLPEFGCFSSWGAPWLLSRVSASTDGGAPRSVILRYEQICEPVGECSLGATTCYPVLSRVEVPSFDSTLGSDTITGGTTSEIGFDFVFKPIIAENYSNGGYQLCVPFLERVAFPHDVAFDFVGLTDGFGTVLEQVTLPSGAQVDYWVFPQSYPAGFGNLQKSNGIHPNNIPQGPESPTDSGATIFGCSDINPESPFEHPDPESLPGSSIFATAGVLRRTITYNIDADLNERTEVTDFVPYRSCEGFDHVDGEWPYDFTYSLGGSISYLWTWVQTSDGQEDSVHTAEIHRFNPVNSMEFSTDYLDSTTFVPTPQNVTHTHGEDFENWPDVTRLKHIEIDRREKFDLGSDGGQEYIRYDYQASKRIFTDIDGEDEFCYEPFTLAPNPPGSATYDCMVVKKTVLAGDVDDYLNVLKQTVDTENAPLWTAVFREQEFTFEDPDLINWRGFNRVKTTETCENVACNTTGYTWEPVYDGAGSVGYYRPLAEFANPGGFASGDFECTPLTLGGCIERNFAYEDPYGNRTSESVRGGYDGNSPPALFNSLVATTHTDYRHGRPTRKRIESGTESLLLWEREIDPNTGLPRWHVNGAGSGFAYLFDELGRITEIAPVNGSYSSNTGWALSIEHYGNEGSTLYPVTGTSIKYELPADSDYGLLEHQVYDSSDQNINGSLVPGTLIELRSSLLFDGRGRPTAWVEHYTDASQNPVERSRVALDFFDLGGRLQRSSEWNPGSDLASTTNWTGTRFDGLNRPTTVTTPDGTQVELSYVGDSVSTVTREVGCAVGVSDCPFATTTITDAVGRVVRIEEQHDVANPELDPIISTYTYDHSDRLIGAEVLDAGGNPSQVRTFDYSTGGFLTRTTEPERTMSYSAYDVIGNVLEETHEDGFNSVSRCYEHDHFGRIDSKFIGDCAEINREPATNYFYGDTVLGGSADVGTHDYNKVATAVQHNFFDGIDVPVTHNWLYSRPAGQVKTRETLIGRFGEPDDAFKVEYEYDAWLNPRVIHHPVFSGEPSACGSEVATTHVHDGSWLNDSDVTLDGSILSYAGANWTYSPSGRPAQVSYYQGPTEIGHLIETADPNRIARPLSIEAEWAVLGETTYSTIWTEGPYAYDGSGNITAIGNGGKAYAYDGLNRLIRFDDQSAQVESYGYDRWGNLISWNRYGTGAFGVTFPGFYLQDDNRPDWIYVDSTPESGHALGWLRGNLTGTPEIPLIGMNSKFYSFTDEDRLKETTSMPDNTVWRYAYDTAGERVATWRRDPSGILRDVKLTIRDEEGSVLTDWLWTDASAFVRDKDYFYSGGKMIAQLNWSGGVADREYFFADHLGSTRVSMKDGAIDPELIEYFPFGGFRVKPVTSTVNHLFTGHERDFGETSSELDYMHARYYSPNLGRFLSVDTVGGEIGSSQSWNRYSYVGNNPIDFIDPDGAVRVKASWTGEKFRYSFGFETMGQHAGEFLAKKLGKKVFTAYYGPAGEVVYRITERAASDANRLLNGSWASLDPRNSGLSQFEGKIAGYLETIGLEASIESAFGGLWTGDPTSISEDDKPLERLNLAINKAINSLDPSKYSDEDKAKLREFYDVNLLGELARDDPEGLPGAEQREKAWERFHRIVEPGTIDR